MAALAINALIRTAIRLKDINENCLEVFREHWNCLDNNNHQMWQCRRPERRLNRCVFEKLVRFMLLSDHLQPTMLTTDLRD
jgi:hypothetical protein